MPDRRTFLAGAGAAALTLTAGVPILASATSMPTTAAFDPAVVFDELRAVGLAIWLCKPVGRDAGPPYYSINPRRGGFTREQLAVMSRWADFLNTHPIEVVLMEAHLAAFEREMGVG